MKHLVNFVAGMFIGTGLILPGVSGAVMAIALGVYDNLIKIFSNIFKDFKNNIIFLVPILLGMAFGTVVFGNVLLYFFETYPVVTKTAFIGLILGSLPIIFNKLKFNNKYKFSYLPFMLALLVGLGLYYLNELFVVSETLETMNGSIDSHIKIFVGGLLYSLGKIVPGVSSSFMLMALGVYEYVLYLISHPLIAINSELMNVLIFTIGFGIGLVSLSKVILFLLNKFTVQTYSAILGFIIGSLFILLPSYTFSLETIISIFIFIITFSLSIIFSIYEIKKKH
jgi:putative membrane protein